MVGGQYPSSAVPESRFWKDGFNPTDGSRGIVQGQPTPSHRLHPNPADGSRGIVQIQPSPRPYEVGLEASTNGRWWDSRGVAVPVCVGRM